MDRLQYVSAEATIFGGRCRLQEYLSQATVDVGPSQIYVEPTLNRTRI